MLSGDYNDGSNKLNIYIVNENLQEVEGNLEYYLYD